MKKEPQPERVPFIPGKLRQAPDKLSASPNGSSLSRPQYQAGSMLAKLRSTENLGPSTLHIIAEAERRGIPWRRMNDFSRILLGYGKNQKLLCATITGQSSCLAVEMVADKYETKVLLDRANIPVPKGAKCTSEEKLKELLQDLDYPLVIKPLDANHGRGVSVNIRDAASALQAYQCAKSYGDEVIVEKYVKGKDHRMLVINGKLVAAACRIPAHVTGDGTSTVLELIAKTNMDPRRGEGHEAVLTKIAVNCDTEKQLKELNYSLETVPDEGETVFLKSTANLSTGGIAVDVTDEVHPENRFVAERIAALTGLDICGIDIIAPDLKTPFSQNNGAVIEVNAAPGFRMHLAPSVGQPRNVASAVIDMLYPSGAESRIPVFAVTGTNGKTTTTRILAHLANCCGYRAGYTTTDGVYIGTHQIARGDCSGPSSASLVLADPMVDFAVLETARGGLLRAGLAFDYCDVGILTNIASDHLGLQNIHTLEELAEVKAAVVRGVKKTGWAVLNAEDDHCNRIAGTLACHIAYFSLNCSSGVFQEHLSKGGLGATVEKEDLVIYRGTAKTFIAKIKDLPLTLEGTSKCMTANILATTAAAFSYGFTPDQIREALMGFIPGPDLTPGRMNHFKVRDFSVLVDYAHNPHGLRAMQDYLTHIKAPRKIGIVSGVGDRRDCDIIELAEIAANMFDHIIVRQEHSLRGRELSEMNALMLKGIEKSGRKIPCDLIPDEKAAIRYALEKAEPGDFVVALSDDYHHVIEIIKEYQQ